MSVDLLRLDGIDTSYGSVQVHFELVRPQSGTVVFDGASILGLPTPAIVGRGIGSVPEAPRRSSP